MSEVPAAEPPTDRPALADPATARALRGLRLPLVALPPAAAVCGVPAIVFAVNGVGGLATPLLTILALALVLATMVAVATTGFWIRPASRLLGDQPWRPARVRVYRTLKGLPRTPLLLREPDGTTVELLAPALSWAAQQVLARTGRVWLVGPDQRGWAAIRSAGLALPLGQARVADVKITGGYEISPVQTAPTTAGTAGEDAVLARAIAGPRRRSRTDLFAPGLLLAFALYVLVDLLRRGVSGRTELLAGLVVVTAAVLGLLAWRVYRLRHWSAVGRLLSAGPWTSVPVTLELPDGAERTVTAQATLPDGRTAPVRFHRASRALLANIAETGRMWTAGAPADGQVAVGLPGYPFLTVARIG